MKNNIIQKLAVVLRNSEILMRELENERDESLENLRYEGEEEILEQYYRKLLSSIYRVRNNAAALLLRNNCTCKEEGDYIVIILDDVNCYIQKKSLSLILQKDYDKIIKNNLTEHPNVISSKNVENMDEKIDIGQSTETSTKEDDTNNLDEFTFNDDDFKDSDDDLFNEGNSINNTSEKEDNISLKNNHKPEIKSYDIEKPKETIIESKETKTDNDLDFGFFDDDDTKDIPTEEKNIQPESNNYISEPIKENKNTDSIQDKDSFDDLDFGFFNDENVPEESNTDKTDISNDNNTQKKETKFNKEDDSFDDLDFGFFNDEDDKPQNGSLTNNNESENSNDLLADKKNFEEDSFGIFDEEDKPLENKSEKQDLNNNVEDPFKNIKKDDFDDLDFGFFDDQQNNNQKPIVDQVKKEEPIIKKEEQEPNNKFKPILNKKPKEKIIEKPKVDVKPKFSSFTDSDDPDEIMKKLKANRKEYDKAKIEQTIEDLQKEEVTGKVFDLSTGSFKDGDLDAEQASDKINKIAHGIIDTSRKDRIMDEKINENKDNDSSAYKIQKYTDYKRNKNNFLLDTYNILVGIKNQDGKIRKEKLKLIVAPLEIPESGTKLSSDICVFMQIGEERHGSAVIPGGKTTIVMRCEDYAVFVRGYWENGNFISVLSLRGNGTQIANKIEKKEIRPNSMQNAGIGHNIIYMDHVTTVHIIPITFTNTNYDHTEIMAVIIRDYGIDIDTECITPGKEIETIINGEKFKYSISAEWNDSDEFEIKTRMMR